MRYASIRSLDVSNGANIGVALFVQGCPFHCYNCFNPDTWDFNDGKEWNEETKNKFFELIDRPYIKRVSLLGGECLAEQNLDDVLSLVKEIRISYPEKSIWLYTGYRIKLTCHTYVDVNDDYAFKNKYSFFTENPDKNVINNFKRSEILNSVDVVVDGEYIDEQRNLSKKWAGSDNQRVIDIKQSIAQNKIVLYCD